MTDYGEASKAYAEIENYEEALRLAMYAQALAAGEAGQYRDAVSNLEKLGDFRDSALQADYYTALSYEQTQDYEAAGEILAGMEFFGDAASRLAGYPEKINARDYAAAESLLSSGNLEKAREAFIALGDYQDSKERAKAVLEKIHERDYFPQRQQAKPESMKRPMRAFVPSGSIKTAKSRPGRCF